MNRRDFIKTMGLGTAALAIPGLTRVAAAGDSKPNIIFLLADDQRFDTMGCMGNPDILTPNMDQLAADGMIFDNHYDTTSICMASRAIIMTGIYEYKTGCNFKHGSMSESTFALSYPVLLRAAGYRTFFAGKFGFPVTPTMTSDDSWKTYDKMPMSDFDVWRGWAGQGNYTTANNLFMADYASEYPHTTRALGAAAQDFIKDCVANHSDQPFCMSVSFKAPHGPLTADPMFNSLYQGVTLSKPVNWGDPGAVHLPDQAKMGRQYGYSKYRDMWYPESNYQNNVRIYYRQIYGIDYAIGMIREELTHQGIADNTIIIYTSDNGYFCGAHAMWGKVLPYEEGSRAPLIIYDPRHPSTGQQLRSPALTGNIDMAPTILDMAGVPIPENMDGRSLAPLLDNPYSEVRDSLLLIQVWPWINKNNPYDPDICQCWSIVTPDWKYIYWFYGDETMEAVEELYDMRTDRLEMHNVIDDPSLILVPILMRGQYKLHHQRWKKNCVPGNGYPEYITKAALPDSDPSTDASQWEYYE